jgi:nucleoside-diphosphate-sugar epimerase
LNQVVIYGANGWLGRSAIAATFDLFPDLSSNSILLLGSKSSNVTIRGKNVEIKEALSGLHLIEENSIFVNCAFLRREQVVKLGEKEYVKQNLRVMELPVEVLKKRRVFSLVNLSSGVAGLVQSGVHDSSQDMYAVLKRRSELELAHEAALVGANFLNCRVFSVSGSYLNEFENLALSLFIAHALKSEPINVRSPESRRSYIDGVNLMTVLFKLAVNGETGNYDSGGICVTMKELAETVSRLIHSQESDIILGEEKGKSYFGDFKKFNELSTQLGVKILDLDEQVQRTLMAFRATKDKI